GATILVAMWSALRRKRSMLIPLALNFVLMPLVSRLFGPFVIGVLSSTYSIRGGELVIHSPAIEIAGAPTLTLLIAIHVILLVAGGLFSWRIARQRRDAVRALEVHAWHLRQLLPAGA